MRVSLLTTLVVLISYAIIIQFASQPSQVRTQSQWQDNRVKVERYLRGSVKPQVVFVGSSLTARLDFQNDDQCIYNMALGGESALTGLNAIWMSDHKPQYIFVEVNVPQIESNQKLIERASGWLPRVSRVFYTENMPSNRIWSELSRLKTSNSEVATSDDVFQTLLGLQIEKNKELIDARVLKQRAEQFKNLVMALEASGSKVIFFEMPIHPHLEASNRAVQVRATFSNTFPKNRFFGFRDLAQDLTIVTTDGIHLKISEAQFVSTQLKKHVRNTCP